MVRWVGGGLDKLEIEQNRGSTMFRLTELGKIHFVTPYMSCSLGVQG